MIPPTTTQRVTTTTRRGYFNFNLNNITNIINSISTVLTPVTSTDFAKPPKCVSRKGKKIEKRILIEEDYDDNDDSLTGETSFSEYPWMLEILKKNRKTGIFVYKCGGVLSEFLVNHREQPIYIAVFLLFQSTQQQL